MSDAPHVAVCPGSFDPLTSGHIDIIERAAALFDRVVVGLLVNPGKTPLFSVDERLAILRDAFAGHARVAVETFDGLLVEFARRTRATTVVRGLRGVSDFDYERQMAVMNRHLHPGLDTIFLMPSPRFMHVSSSLVRDIASHGGSLAGLVPPAVIERLNQRRHAAMSDRA